MDNLTHTLIGVLAGESIARAASAAGSGLPHDVRRNLIVTTMAVGGNLPDLDFLYSAVTGGKLDYLLHHRGHTHTLVGALAMAALLVAALFAWLRWRRLQPGTGDRLLLLSTALFAPLLHIAMDLANNYGVHPFWPWDNQWFYGDAVFIIEPLLWAACAPLALLLRTRAARAAVVLALGAGIALTFFSGLVPIAHAIAFTLLVTALVTIGRRGRPAAALACGVGVWLGVTGAFAIASDVAGRRIDAVAAEHFADDVVYDRVLTPMPVNPVCWEVILISARGGDLALRRAMLSLLPVHLPARRCVGRSRGAKTTAPLQPVAVADDGQTVWHGQIVTSRSRLAQLVDTDCRAAAFLRFARAPWLAAVDARLVFGDLRYDFEPELGFAEIDVTDAPARCPIRVPSWLPPRTDVLH